MDEKKDKKKNAIIIIENDDCVITEGKDLQGGFQKFLKMRKVREY